MQFRNITGQTSVKTRLIQSASENRISHCQLFTGPSGSGNLALAFAYAQYILCSSPGPEDSCGTCSSCQKSAKFIHPDIHYSYPIVSKKGLEKPVSSDYAALWREALTENPYMNIQDWLFKLDGENKQGNISVDECHDIIRKLSLKSYEGGYKILIMWMPEFLGNAGNTLLKIIEEPPPSTLFILVGEKPDQIIATVTSRSQLIKINRIQDNDMKAGLMEKFGLDEQRATEVAGMVHGDMNAAIHLLKDQDETLSFGTLFLHWLRNCYTRNAQEIIKSSEEFASMGKEKQKAFFYYGMHIFREALISKVKLPVLQRVHGQELEQFSRLFEFIGTHNLPDLVHQLNEAIYHLERNANSKILFTDLSLKVHVLLRTPVPA